MTLIADTAKTEAPATTAPAVVLSDAEKDALVVVAASNESKASVPSAGLAGGPRAWDAQADAD